MSCRVLKRDMELALLDEVVRKCQELSVEEIRGYYYPTAKNAMVKEFYGTLGFDKISEDAEGNSVWSFKVNKEYVNKNKFIDVVR